MISQQKNVLGYDLEYCGTDPITGFYRDGCCNTGPGDVGTHTICAVLTAEFLHYSATRGNDLKTPRLESGSPGLKPGDLWCLCALRWEEARQVGKAPKVKLASTNIRTLEIVTLEQLKLHSFDLN